MSIEAQFVNNKKISILVTIDRNYLSPLITMLKSYLPHHKNVETDIYIANSSLDSDDFFKIEAVLGADSIKIHDVKITEGYFSNMPVIERLSEESFYRLLAFLYLPDEIDRCLYLDPDILINKSLVELYNMDMGDSYIAAAGHMRGMVELINHKRLDLKDEDRYVNSGVMLMNLSAIRRDFTLETVLSCINDNISRLILGDQDAANILFGANSILLDEKIYNLDERCFKYYKKHQGFDIERVKRETAIIHYNGKYKPWLDGYRGELDVLYPKPSKLGNAPKGIVKKQIKSIIKIINPTKQQIIAIVGISVFLLLCLLSYIFFGNELVKLVSDPTGFRRWLDKFGVFDELFFILLRSAQTVVKFLPSEPLEIGAGYAWGTVLGMIYCLIGNVLGSLVIIFLTKKLGNKILKTFASPKGAFDIEVLKNSKSIYAVIFIFYLIPGTPKDGFTYFVSFLPIKTLPFMILTTIARIPSVISSTICGSTLAEGSYLISALVFLATAVIAIVGAMLYKSYIKKEKRQSD